MSSVTAPAIFLRPAPICNIFSFNRASNEDRSWIMVSLDWLGLVRQRDQSIPAGAGRRAWTRGHHLSEEALDALLQGNIVIERGQAVEETHAAGRLAEHVGIPCGHCGDGH